ncbi:MAG: methyltransferase domain-containing protein, partial [Candidatus Diapherotrites archaeon]|nr:methyltransferase domain-containing protein [Candidatus Diapherotrites archaeon]
MLSRKSLGKKISAVKERFSDWNSKRALTKFESRTGVTKKAHAEADIRNQDTSFIHSDFGRTLAYYKPFHVLLKKFGGKLKGKSLLHLASSSGIFTSFLQSFGMKTIAFDSSEHAAEISKAIGNKKIVRGSAPTKSITDSPKNRSLPFKDSSFDFFVSDNFLFSRYYYIDFNVNKVEHTSTDVLNEIHRILKPKGIGIVHL